VWNTVRLWVMCELYSIQVREGARTSLVCFYIRGIHGEREREREKERERERDDV
jgi:hypothetical protein